MKSYISRKLPLETRTTALTCLFTRGILPFPAPGPPAEGQQVLGGTRPTYGPASGVISVACERKGRGYAPDSTCTGSIDSVRRSPGVRSGVDRVLKPLRRLPRELSEAAAGEGHRLPHRIRADAHCSSARRRGGDQSLL